MVDKDKFIKELNELIDNGEIKATWEGIFTEIVSVSVNEQGTIILDVNEY